MTDEMKLKKAKEVYNSLCAMLEEKELHFEKYEDDLVVTFGMRGDDLPMQFILNIDAKRELIRMISPIPVTFGDDVRELGAIATCQANYRLADGSFDYDFKQGKITFRITSSYKDSEISKVLLEYMIAVACYTVDDYNDKFLLLSKGLMSIEEFFTKK